MSSEDINELLVHPHTRKVIENIVLRYLQRLSTNERRNLWRLAKKVYINKIPPRGYLTYKEACVKYNYQIQTMRLYVAKGLFTGAKGVVLEKSIIDYKPLYRQKRGALNHGHKQIDTVLHASR